MTQLPTSAPLLMRHPAVILDFDNTSTYSNIISEYENRIDMSENTTKNRLYSRTIEMLRFLCSTERLPELDDDKLRNIIEHVVDTLSNKEETELIEILKGNAIADMLKTAICQSST